MTARGQKTKDELLAAAERLFAKRGIDSVSLREVNAAAGQRNNAALHYHFGDRAGLMQAIAAKHMPRIAARQQELLEAAERAGRLSDFRTLVEIVWLPSAECIAAGPSERAWLRIAADLGTRPQTALEDVSTAAGAAAWTAGVAILEVLARDMPRDFAANRIWAASESVIHVLASRARYEEDPKPRRSAPPLELFIADLIDTTCAMLQAPMSEQTRVARAESLAEVKDSS
jgi:AcrR family transcriptional regulator